VPSVHACRRAAAFVPFRGACGAAFPASAGTAVTPCRPPARPVWSRAAAWRRGSRGGGGCCSERARRCREHDCGACFFAFWLSAPAAVGPPARASRAAAPADCTVRRFCAFLGRRGTLPAAPSWSWCRPSASTTTGYSLRRDQGRRRNGRWRRCCSPAAAEFLPW
jgi:hypothetical protein